MVSFLHRTSSHKVYEIILHEQSTEIEKISQEMLKLGHKRQKADLKGMIGILEHFGLLEEKNQEQSKILIKGDYQDHSESLVYVANKLIISRIFISDNCFYNGLEVILGTIGRVSRILEFLGQYIEGSSHTLFLIQRKNLSSSTFFLSKSAKLTPLSGPLFKIIYIIMCLTGIS